MFRRCVYRLMFIDRSDKILQSLETKDGNYIGLVGWIPNQQTAIIQNYEIDVTKTIERIYEVQRSPLLGELLFDEWLIAEEREGLSYHRLR